MLLRWSGHRLGTWLVKEQRVSLGSAWGGGIIQLLKQTDPSFLKCLFSPPLFVLLKLLWDPDGAVWCSGFTNAGTYDGSIAL